MNDAEYKICLGELFFKSLNTYGNKVFLYDNEVNEAVTFSEILSQSIRVTLKLKKKGINKNDIVATCTHNQKYSCLPIIASQYLGAICANLDPSLSGEDTVYLLKLVEPKIIFVSEEKIAFIQNCISEAQVKTELVIFGSSEKYEAFSSYLQPHEEELKFQPENIDENETAAILFSSGTTGKPKGICLSHRSIRNGGLDFIPYNITKKNPTVSLIFSTFYWISAYMNLVKCISNGYAMVLCKKFDAESTWALIEKYKVTFIFLAPYNAIACLKKKPKNVDYTSLEVLMTGSCPVSENLMLDLRKNFQFAKILNVYGQTEFGGAYCEFNPLNEEEYKLQLTKPTSSGKMKPHVSWKIVDLISGEILGPNKEGELRVRSKDQMIGYYKMDSSYAFDSDGYLKTGDIAFYDDDNCIYIVDRAKEMFKYKGWHIVPSVLEDILKSHPAVLDAAVIGIAHEEDGFHPMGVVELHDDDTDTDVNSILSFANNKLSENQKLRAGLRIFKSLPKTATGKVKRLELQKMLLNGLV